MLLLVITLLVGSTPVLGRQLTFGTAYKGCWEPCFLPNGTQNLWPFFEELTVFSHTCDSGATCVMSHFWAGGTWPGYAHSRLRYYVDGEERPSVDVPFGLVHGDSMIDGVYQAPWSAGSLFGWTGLPEKGGIFNTYPIPFGKEIRVTVELRTTAPVGHREHDPVGFWVILRGHLLEGHLMLPGPLQRALPLTARLRSATRESVIVAPGGMLELMASAAKRADMLMVSLAVSCGTDGCYLGFLEGCMRAYNSASPGSSPTLLLSSGTEDYFVGTFYFESGLYTTPLAGITRRNGTHANATALGGSFSAYRVHASADPLSFEGGLSITWRNGDGPGCNASMEGYSLPVDASSVVLFYES